MRFAETRGPNRERCLEIALRLFVLRPAQEHTATSDALYTRGRVHLRRAEYEQAKRDIEATLAIRAARFGEAHTSYRNALTLLPQIELGLGDVAAAERHALRLLELVEANDPDNKVLLRRALNVWRQVLERTGDAQRLQAVETRLAALNQ